MKILHTADWHIGKRLYRNELLADHQHFFNWLQHTVEEEGIDYLLISGDIFDLANPSNEARKLYYETLVALVKSNCKLIITGGNHDSPSVLHAPKALLNALDITVIGKLPEQLESLLIPLKDANGQTKAVVAAIPYLRDAELRKQSVGETMEERQEQIKKGIKNILDQVASLAEQHYPNIPLIGMGHLYAHGVVTSESERDIQMGNLAGFESTQFPEAFQYMALGHIHQPQIVGKQAHIRYSGAPIALSFSEQKDQKQVVLITLKESLDIQSVLVPAPRKLIRIKGTLTHIQEKLSKLPIQNTALPSFIEIEMREPQSDPVKTMTLIEQIESFNREDALIIKHKITYENVVSGTADLFDSKQLLDELKPTEVFQKRMDIEVLDEQKKTILLQAFSELLQDIERGT